MGDTKFEILQKCGEPLTKEESGPLVMWDDNVAKKFYVEKWVYDFKHGYYEILEFYDDMLYQITSKKK